MESLTDPSEGKKIGPAKVVWVERVGLEELGEMGAGPRNKFCTAGRVLATKFQGKTLYSLTYDPR